MTDKEKVHPSAKSNDGAPAANTSLPATKPQLPGVTTRPTYRHQHRRRRRRSSRGCCCILCFWLILVLLFILLLLGAAGTAVYFLYRPHRPSFSVTSLKLTPSEFDLTLSATNPNSKITFSYGPISVAVLAGDVDIGDGTIPSFEHGKENTTLLKASVARSVKSKSAESELKVKLETKVEAKAGMFKTPHVGIGVLCDGIDVSVPAGDKLATAASTADAKCQVDVRFKVWKWTLG